MNVIVHIAREAVWSQQHPDIMGPSNSYLYFGPSMSPGYLVYGNGPEVAMVNHLRQKKDASTWVPPYHISLNQNMKTVIDRAILRHRMVRS